ncbi:MAG: hypothetical protein JSS75_03995 [Bacteroidetes bacterium]|nr:hypothetical protein [Bacteroidota bacterium]
MSTEDRILDYLDGSLNEHDSAELMHQLSVSPEKRVILEQHIKLSELTRVAQRPFDVPVELEETLAKRLPAVIGTTTTTALRGRSAISSLLLLLRQYPIRFALGGLVTLLAGGAVYWYGMAGSPSPNDVPTSDRRFGSASTSEHSSATDAHTPLGMSTAPSPSNIQPATGTSQPTGAVADNSGVHSNVVSSTSATGNKNTDLRPDRIHAIAHSSQPRQRMHRSEVVSAEHTNIDARDRASSTTEIIGQHTETAVASESSIAQIPTVAIRDAGMTNIIGSNSGSRQSLRDLVTHPDGRRSDWALRGSLGFGTTFLYVPSGSNSYVTRTEVNPLLGIDRMLDAHWAVGVEGGVSSSQALTPTSSVISDPSISRIVTHATSTTSTSTFMRLALRYTVNPYDAVRIELSAGGGRAFGSAGGWMGSAQAGISFQPGLTDGLDFQVFALYSGVLTNTTATTVTTPSSVSGPVEYSTTSTPQSRIFTPAITLRAGFQYRLP